MKPAESTRLDFLKQSSTHITGLKVRPKENTP